MILRILIHLVVFLFLTFLTQIGGVIYLIANLAISKKVNRRRVKRIGLFALLYFLITLLLVPSIAPIYGREKVSHTINVEAHTLFTVLTNRNYIKPELNTVLEKVSIGLSQKHKDVKIVYLDANFPFRDGFPLLPHRSHKDGKKLDLSLIYKTKDGKWTNRKKSISGYGVYEGPEKGEYDQITKCKNAGNWQYDFPKYLTFGKVNKDLSLSEKVTKDLILEVVKQQAIGKVFIEPHLKRRLRLSNDKIRFQGCKAVRHDDHIHIQLR